jgi:hypothetical protein
VARSSKCGNTAESDCGTSKPSYLIMWVSGHRHLIPLKPLYRLIRSMLLKKASGKLKRSRSGIFCSSSALLRFFLNTDNSVSIVITNVDPAVKKGTPAATSRKYAVAATQIVRTWGFTPRNNPTNDQSIKPMQTSSYNAEPVKQLRPEI